MRKRAFYSYRKNFHMKGPPQNFVQINQGEKNTTLLTAIAKVSIKVEMGHGGAL